MDVWSPTHLVYCDITLITHSLGVLRYHRPDHPLTWCTAISLPWSPTHLVYCDITLITHSLGVLRYHRPDHPLTWCTAISPWSPTHLVYCDITLITHSLGVLRYCPDHQLTWCTAISSPWSPTHLVYCDIDIALNEKGHCYTGYTHCRIGGFISQFLWHPNKNYTLWTRQQIQHHFSLMQRAMSKNWSFRYIPLTLLFSTE